MALTFNQEFKGVVKAKGITITEDKGEITFTKEAGEFYENLASEMSLPALIGRQAKNNDIFDEAIGDVADSFIGTINVNSSPLTVTDNTVSFTVPTATSDLSNDSNFGRPVIAQTYSAIDTNDYTTITPPLPYTLADIFAITINGTADTFSSNSTLIGTALAIHNADTSIIFITNMFGPDFASSVAIATIDDDGDFTGIDIDGEATLTIYYK